MFVIEAAKSAKRAALAYKACLCQTDLSPSDIEFLNRMVAGCMARARTNWEYAKRMFV